MTGRQLVRATGPLAPLALLAAAAAGASAGSGAASSGGMSSAAIIVYVGTYTGGQSRGIYRFALDPVSGGATTPVLAAASKDPSFLALHPGGRLLYAVNETDDFGDRETGAVSAFAIDPSSRDLRLLDQQPSGGAHPCHVTLDGAGRHLFVANYTGGTVAVFPIAEDGRLEPASSTRRHEGRGPRGDRQEAPHPHAVVLDPTERFCLAADLGTDRIFTYRFDAARGALEPNDPSAAVLEPGSGPRHLAFHPSLPVLYAIDELVSTVTVLSWNGEAGRLTPGQTVTTLPAGFAGENTTAEITVSPDGRFVYGSNRGHDSLAVFRVDMGTGRLSSVAHVPTGGRNPRHFALDPTGRWLLAANQDSGTIVVFRIDSTSGLPRPTSTIVRVDRPVCVLPVPPTP